jgi:SAM-dependent methyltransferase
LKLKLIRLKKNIKNYIRSKKAAKNALGLIRRDFETGKLIEKVIIENSLINILDIGTWNGLGSTKTFIEELQENFEKYSLVSIETDKIFHKQALKNLNHLLNPNIQLLLGRIIEIDELPNLKNIDFEAAGLVPDNVEWLIQDIRRYEKVENIFDNLPTKFDFILFDGGEFSNYSEFLKLYKTTKYFGLDDTNTYKQYEVLKYIENNFKEFQLINSLETFSIYKVVNLINDK